MATVISATLYVVFGVFSVHAMLFNDTLLLFCGLFGILFVGLLDLADHLAERLKR